MTWTSNKYTCGQPNKGGRVEAIKLIAQPLAGHQEHDWAAGWLRVDLCSPACWRVYTVTSTSYIYDNLQGNLEKDGLSGVLGP